MSSPKNYQFRQEILKLKARVNLIDFAEQHGLIGTMSDKGLSARTPWRDDRKPSLTVYTDGFMDWATGDHGDLFDYVDRIGIAHKIREQMQYVRNWLGDPANTRSMTLIPSGQLDTPPKPPDKQWQTRSAAFVETAATYLFGGTPDAVAVLDYLTGRGLTLDTIRAARIGFYPGGDNWKIAPGVVIPNYYDGILIAVRIRRRQDALAAALGMADDKGDRYRCVTGSKPSAGWYDATAAIGKAIALDAPIIVVGGEIKALVVAQVMDGWRVITRTSESAGYPTWLAAQLAGRTVYLSGDNDPAGQKALERWIKDLSGIAAELFTATMPGGIKAADDAVLAGHDLHTLIAAAVPVLLVTSKPANSVPTTKVAQPPDQWISALPDAHRDAIHAGYCHASIAPVLELAIEAYLANLLPNMFTVKQLAEAGAQLGRCVTTATIRRALSFPDFFAVVDPYITDKKEEDDPLEAAVTTAKKSRIGAPVKHYRLPTPEQVRDAILKEAALRIQEKHFNKLIPMPTSAIVKAIDPILDAITAAKRLKSVYGDIIAEQPKFSIVLEAARAEYKQLQNKLDSAVVGTPLDAGKPYANSADHRALFARQRTIESIGKKGQLSRKEIGELTGCDPSYAARVMRRAGIQSQQCKQEVQVSADRALAAVHKPEWDRQVEGRPIAVYVENVRYGVQTPQATAAVKRAADAGMSVVIEYQQKNILTVLDAPILAAPRKRSVSNTGKLKVHYHPGRDQWHGGTHQPQWVHNHFVHPLYVLTFGATVPHVDPNTGETSEPPPVELLAALLAGVDMPVQDIAQLSPQPPIALSIGQQTNAVQPTVALTVDLGKSAKSDDFKEQDRPRRIRHPYGPCPHCSCTTDTGGLCRKCNPSAHIGERVERLHMSAKFKGFQGKYTVTAGTPDGLPVGARRS